MTVTSQFRKPLLRFPDVTVCPLLGNILSPKKDVGLVDLETAHALST